MYKTRGILVFNEFVEYISKQHLNGTQKQTIDIWVRFFERWLTLTMC